jgi:hypothetical protein
VSKAAIANQTDSTTKQPVRQTANEAIPRLSSTNPLWDVREDATGMLCSQHLSLDDAERAIPWWAAQELTVWPHVSNQPDFLYKNGYGRDPHEQRNYAARLYADLDAGKPLDFDRIYRELSPPERKDIDAQYSEGSCIPR